MLFWYAGFASVLVYATLGRRRIDYRMIILGAVAPGIVDAAARAAGAPAPGGRGLAHSVLAVVVVAAVVILGTRGGLRLSLFGLAVGWLLHLVADGMWGHPRTFLWPAFGTTFVGAGIEPYFSGAFGDPLGHAGIWLKELAGIGALVWFSVAFRLQDPERRARFARDGLLRA